MLELILSYPYCIVLYVTMAVNCILLYFTVSSVILIPVLYQNIISLFMCLFFAFECDCYSSNI